MTNRCVQFTSVTQSCLTLCNHMNRSTTGLPVHHQIPESTQTHVHCVSDATQPSHPLSPPSPSTPHSLKASGSFPLSQLFISGSQIFGVSASVPQNSCISSNIYLYPNKWLIFWLAIRWLSSFLLIVIPYFPAFRVA